MLSKLTLVKPRAVKRTVGNFGVERSFSEIPENKLTLRLSVSVCLKKNNKIKKKTKKIMKARNVTRLVSLPLFSGRFRPF